MKGEMGTQESRVNNDETGMNEGWRGSAERLFCTTSARFLRNPVVGEIFLPTEFLCSDLRLGRLVNHAKYDHPVRFLMPTNSVPSVFVLYLLSEAGEYILVVVKELLNR